MITQLVDSNQSEYPIPGQRDFIANRPNALTDRMMAFALQLIEAHHSLPVEGPGRTDSGNLLRSGTKVLALYRKAYRANSWDEFVEVLVEATRVTEETLYWMAQLERTAAVNLEQTRALYLSCREIGHLMELTIAEVRARTDPHV